MTQPTRCSGRPKYGARLLSKGGLNQTHGTHFSHCFIVCFPDFLGNQKLDNSFYRRHVRRLRNMKKLISGEKNDKSENGILKML